MHAVLLIGFACTFPVVCLLMVLWLDRLEETLPASMRAARRAPDPAPILAMPVRATAQPAPVQPERRIPRQRVGEDSLSAALSLGGSTNR